MLQSQFGCGVSPVEAVGTARSGNDDKGSLTVAAIESLVQVALLGLGRQTRGGAAALDIDHHQGQFGHHSQTQSLALQRQTGTRSAGAGQSTGIAGTDGGTNTCNLVFGLEHTCAQSFVLRQLDHHVRGGSDGVTAKEQAATAALRSSQQTPCGGHITGDIAVTALGHLSMGDFEDMGVDNLQLVGILITLTQHSLVQLDDIGLLGKLALQISKSLVKLLVRHIEDDTQCEHVAALVGSLLVGTLFLTDASGERGDGSLNDGVGTLHFLGERILLVTGLLHSLVGESVDIHNHRSTLLCPLQIGFERGWVHGHKNITLVARTINMVTHMHLITRNACDCVVRSTNLSRIVGESGDVVTRQCRGVGKQRTRQLHTVARVTGKADDEVIFINYLIV